MVNHGIALDVEKQLNRFLLRPAFSCQERRMGILGPSGAGKSMTLKLIAGVAAPDRGKITLGETCLYDSARKIALPPQKRKIGYLFQNYALFPTMTVAGNIAAGLHCPRNQRGGRVQALIRRFRLEGLEGQKPGRLSGGQQQRTALARMMAAEPEALLLDEPFSALDQSLRDQVMGELLAFLEEFPGPSILVSHSLEETYRFSRWLAVMDEGEIIASGPREQVFSQPGSVRAARILGVENLIPAKKQGEGQVYLPDWDCTLEVAHPLPKDISALGLRSRSLCSVPPGTPNALPVQVAERVDTPFSTRCRGGPEGRPLLTWEEEKGAAGGSRWLYLPPDQAMPLTGAG